MPPSSWSMRTIWHLDARDIVVSMPCMLGAICTLRCRALQPGPRWSQTGFTDSAHQKAGTTDDSVQPRGGLWGLTVTVSWIDAVLFCLEAAW